jgi:hypothetical protein
MALQPSSQRCENLKFNRTLHISTTNVPIKAGNIALYSKIKTLPLAILLNPLVAEGTGLHETTVLL